MTAGVPRDGTRCPLGRKRDTRFIMEVRAIYPKDNPLPSKQTGVGISCRPVTKDNTSNNSNGQSSASAMICRVRAAFSSSVNPSNVGILRYSRTTLQTKKPKIKNGKITKTPLNNCSIFLLESVLQIIDPTTVPRRYAARCPRSAARAPSNNIFCPNNPVWQLRAFQAHGRPVGKCSVWVLETD